MSQPTEQSSVDSHQSSVVSQQPIVVSQSSDVRRATSDDGRCPFVHLHAHTMYSLSDALGSPKKLVKKAKELGYDSIAITDHNGLYGVIDFYEACQKEGIKPIVGIEANIAPNTIYDKRPRIDDWT